MLFKSKFWILKEVAMEIVDSNLSFSNIHTFYGFPLIEGGKFNYYLRRERK